MTASTVIDDGSNKYVKQIVVVICGDREGEETFIVRNASSSLQPCPPRGVGGGAVDDNSVKVLEAGCDNFCWTTSMLETSSALQRRELGVPG